MRRLNLVKTETLLDRFLRYVKIDTQSAEDREEYPSTPKQLDLLKLLLAELQRLGAADARLDRYGYLTAT
ncbi:MAG: peptidase T, partial [Elusimicrobia bacterium]|nr:peptidase T [Elusimicrobiota bacterium]